MSWPRFQLRMKQRSDVELMAGEFDGPEIASVAESRDFEPRGFEPSQVIRIDAVIAKVTGLDRVHSIDGAQTGIR